MAKGKPPPPDGLKQSLGRALEHDRRRRGDRQSQARQAKAPKRPKQSLEAEASGRRAVDQVVSKEAQRHGHFREVDFKLQEVTEGGKRKEKVMRVIRNLGGTPVERWHAHGKLDERQMAGILFYQNAWRRWMGEPRVVANWSAVIVRDAMGAAEVYANSTLAAKESLRLLDQEVFFRLPIEYFHVWQNVVIFDEPGGVAGSRAGFVHKPAEAVARLIVSTVATMVADLVIDSSRRDFGDLLLDLDAPRRAGKKRA